MGADFKTRPHERCCEKSGRSGGSVMLRVLNVCEGGSERECLVQWEDHHRVEDLGGAEQFQRANGRIRCVIEGTPSAGCVVHQVRKRGSSLKSVHGR